MILNRHITCTEIKAVIKSLPKKKIPELDDFINEFYKTFKDQFFSDSSQEFNGGWEYSHTYYKANITLILKLGKDNMYKSHQ